MGTVAFICPLYDMRDHFDYALNLYRSKLEFDIEEDMIFVFSDNRQKEKFEGMIHELDQNEMLKYVILPDMFSKYKAQANTKKLFGLKYYMSDYDYIILLDCESKFIKHCDFGVLAEEIWDSRNMLVSNVSLDGFFILRTCYKAMGLYGNKKLRRELCNYKYNFWFNDLQVYKTELLPEFFDWLSTLDLDAILNTHYCFEYYVFFAFLCLKHDFHIKKYHYVSMGGINEYMPQFSVVKQKQLIERMGVHWCSSEDVAADNIVMIFHLDRTHDCNKYGYSATRLIKLKLFLKRYFFLLKDFLAGELQ